MTVMPQTPVEIAEAYLAALEAAEFEQARFYLDDHNFEYRSPIFNSNDPDQFISDISHVGSILERIDRRRTFTEGNEVCQILTFVTVFSSVKTTEVIQWTKVRDGKIISMEAVFDGRAYRDLFSLEVE